MKSAVLCALTLALGACGEPQPATPDANPGARLEAAATGAGLIPDPRHASLTGSWALDTDRACVVPGNKGVSRIGLLVDYGDGQGCAASGTVERDGEQLTVKAGRCTVKARFDGERMVFPPDLPKDCAALCTGRASLESFTVEQLSGSASEAATLRTPRGQPLCTG
ncbi:hypothetical protein [Sphingomonas aerophila]|uniref:Lipoprotein n=1 Tax=Sphingomonas aerophila TaxID=1344948 RepID=A0A7W9BBA7_9SPHN|nr:hypothetical protein [Sphingomonas aerophila]